MYFYRCQYFVNTFLRTSYTIFSLFYLAMFLNLWLFFQISLKVFTFDVRSAILVPLKKARRKETNRQLITEEYKEIKL